MTSKEDLRVQTGGMGELKNAANASVVVSTETLRRV